MILSPPDYAPDRAQAPRLALGLSIILVLTFVIWHLADMKRVHELNEFYRSHLLAIEWDLYETHAGRSGKASIMPSLKHAAARGDIAKIRSQLGNDDAFVEDIQAQGKSYMPIDTFEKWQAARSQFDIERRKLASQAIGVTPSKFRPITFLTYGLAQPDIFQLIGILFLLLSAGIAIELTLGSGALLTAWLGGGIVGGVVYLAANGSGAQPLTGGGAAIASVAGMFLIHFRTKHTFRFNHIPATSIIILPLWLAFLATGFWVSGLRLPELLAQAGGFLSAPLWYLAYKHWFSRTGQSDEPGLNIESIDDAYRLQLQVALDAIGRMDFLEARQRLREMINAYPNDLRILTQLFQLEKINPESNTFDAVARRIFTLANTDANALIALAIYREYERTSVGKHALDIDTSLKLVIRFAKLGELKDSERLMKQVIDRKAEHMLLPKAALAIAQTYEKQGLPNKAERYREMAEKSRESN